MSAGETCLKNLALAAAAVAFGLCLTQVRAATPVSTDAATRAAEARAAEACQKNAYNCEDAPNPLPRTNTVWFEEMTWMDVRDALAAGKRTIIIPTGGIEPNGPWVALGKHDYILRATCEAIARKLGDALCAPVIGFVHEEAHMNAVGSISIGEETYEALLSEIARSMQKRGFEHIILISDNGGDNQAGMKRVAEKLSAEWHGKPDVHDIPEYYKSWEGADAILLKKGVTRAGVRDGIHDDPSVAVLLMTVNPEYLRWSERVKAGKATIDGVPLTDREKVVGWGRELLEYRSRVTAEAIRKAIQGR